MKKITLLLTAFSVMLGYAQTPTTAAATPPARNATDVISIYGSAYTNISGVNTNPNWFQNTVVTEVQIAGNDVLKYANFNYQGTDWSGNPQNIATMEYLHVDVWTNSQSPNVFAISGGPEVAHPIASVAGAWQSLDIPVAGLTQNLNNVFQFKFDGGTGGTIFLDNLYFWKNPANPLTDATLSGISVGGTPIVGFGAATTSYTYELVVGTTTVPTITATTTNSGASAVVTQATGIPGSATIAVTAANGTTTQTYTVAFVATLPNASPNFTSTAATSLGLLSDIADTNGFTTFWNPSYYFGSNVGTPDLNSSETVNKAVKMDFSIAGWGGGINNGADVYTNVAAYGFVNFSYFANDVAGVNGHDVRFILIGGGGAPSGMGSGEFNYVLKAPGATPSGDGTLVFGSWQNVSIPMSFFIAKGFSPDNFFQFKLGSASDLNTKVVYFDNIFFSATAGTLSNEKFDVIALTAFPNPSSNVWNITSKQNISSIQLFDMLGKNVQTIQPNANQAVINASELPSGIYFANVSTENGRKVIKLVKN